MALMMLPALAGEPAHADEVEDDEDFFEFLGSFEAEDDEWLESLLSDEAAAPDDAPEPDYADETP